jgi:hypothetical protein
MYAGVTAPPGVTNHAAVLAIPIPLRSFSKGISLR